MEEELIKTKEKKSSLRLFKPVVVLVILAVLSSGWYFVSKRNSSTEQQQALAEQQQALNKQQQALAEQQQALTEEQKALSDDLKVLAQLKKIILLPDNITPTMAVVVDAEALRKQQPVFFANAKVGDRVILYPDMAIIYDYQANKIIKIGPVQNAQPTSKQKN